MLFRSDENSKLVNADFNAAELKNGLALTNLAGFRLYVSSNLPAVGTGAATSGTSNVISIFTNQANNEEVRLYAIGVEMLDATTGAALATDLDYSVSIQVGPNNVPSNAFSAGFINSKNDRTLAFSSPILVLFQQPLQVTVTTNQAVAANGSIIKVTLIGELAIQKIEIGRAHV